MTLVTRVRGADWVYTYLRSFYEDPSRPYGVNNLVYKDVGMPHVLEGLQGKQVIGRAPVAVGFDPLTGKNIYEEQDGVLFIEEKGQLDEKEFDVAIADLTNFLVYMAEPIALERQRIGYWVLLFLLILFVPVYYLNREFWRDIH